MSKNKSARGFSSVDKNKDSEKIFWSNYHKANGQPAYKIDRALLSDWLAWNGYYIISTFGVLLVVKLSNNIVRIKTPQKVFNDALAFVKKQDNDLLRSCFIEQGENMLMSKKAILGSLPKLEMERYSDSLNEVRLFYKNTVVKIGAESVKLERYKKFRQLNQYIFSDRIIERDFKVKNNKESDFAKFLRLSTNGKKHFRSVQTALGYLISSYKNPSLAKAVIITDILSQVKNEAFGRSGKGILIKALSEIIKVVEYNGKATDLNTDKFVFQNVDINSALIVLQDVTKGLEVSR